MNLLGPLLLHHCSTTNREDGGPGKENPTLSRSLWRFLDERALPSWLPDKPGSKMSDRLLAPTIRDAAKPMSLPAVFCIHLLKWTRCRSLARAFCNVRDAIRQAFRVSEKKKKKKAGSRLLNPGSCLPLNRGCCVKKRSPIRSLPSAGGASNRTTRSI